MNNLVTTFEGITVGQTINNPDCGTYTVVAINADKDRTLLLDQNPKAFNRYIGAFALQKNPNGNRYFWGQGHYFGGNMQSAMEYVLGIENKQQSHFIVINTWATDSMSDSEIIAVCHTMKEAQEVFKDRLVSEKAIAYEHGWEVYEDDGETIYDAGEDGYYANNFTRLFIQKAM